MSALVPLGFCAAPWPVRHATLELWPLLVNGLGNVIEALPASGEGGEEAELSRLHTENH